MEYREACKIGTVMDGYVKCTYARIFNENLQEYLFSFQRAHLWRNEVYEDFKEEIEHIGAVETDPDYNVSVTQQFPILTADENSDFTYMGKQYVRATLNKYAGELLLNKARNGKRKNNERGRYWERLQQDMQSFLMYGKPVIKCAVRADAIDWIPTDLKNITINDEYIEDAEIKLNSSLKEAESKLNKAKTLLGIALSTNII